MADGQSDVSTAAERLDKALAALEGRMRALKTKASHVEGGLFDQGDSHASAELEAARAREKSIEDAAREASAALSRAAEEIRAILNGEG